MPESGARGSSSPRRDSRRPRQLNSIAAVARTKHEHGVRRYTSQLRAAWSGRTPTSLVVRTPRCTPRKGGLPMFEAEAGTLHDQRTHSSEIPKPASRRRLRVSPVSAMLFFAEPSPSAENFAISSAGLGLPLLPDGTGRDRSASQIPGLTEARRSTLSAAPIQQTRQHATRSDSSSLPSDPDPICSPTINAMAMPCFAPDSAPQRQPKQGSMNTAVERAGILNVPVLLWNFEVLTTGSCENACTGCSTRF
jgi:hypothetical protein